MIADTPTTAVTGANGFVGQHLCAALRRRGLPARAVVRAGRPAPEAAERAEIADLADRRGLARAFAGVDRVVHLAGRAHVLRGEGGDALVAFRATNVGGTEAVLAAAIDAGVRQVVLVSSLAAAGGEQPDPHGADGDAPTTPYGVSKLEAEAAAIRAAALGRIALTVVRPPMVYGPGMRGNPLRLFDLLARGVPLPLGGVRNRRSMVYVGNLAAALLAALDHPTCGIGPYYVSDGAPVSTPAFVRAAAAALGVRVRLLPVPPALLRAAARGADLVAPRSARRSARDAVERLVGSVVVDDGPLRACAGYEPPHSMADGLAETARWYRGRAAIGT